MPVYITPAGQQALLDEYTFLMKKERPRITREVQYAASLGDRSENAEYQYGKKRLREIDRRLRYLQRRLEGVEVVDPALYHGLDIVRFGATVTVEGEDGEERAYTVVGKDEIDAATGRISYLSPLGRALIGQEEGDEVRFRAPGGDRTLAIVAVSYPEPG